MRSLHIFFSPTFCLRLRVVISTTRKKNKEKIQEPFQTYILQLLLLLQQCEINKETQRTIRRQPILYKENPKTPGHCRGFAKSFPSHLCVGEVAGVPRRRPSQHQGQGALAGSLWAAAGQQGTSLLAAGSHQLHLRPIVPCCRSLLRPEIHRLGEGICPLLRLLLLLFFFFFLSSCCCCVLICVVACSFDVLMSFVGEVFCCC